MLMVELANNKKRQNNLLLLKKKAKRNSAGSKVYLNILTIKINIYKRFNIFVLILSSKLNNKAVLENPI